MKNSRRHRNLFFSTLMLAAAGVCAALPGMAQTPAGTTIRNEARASFLYTNGESDSVRSNATETVTLQPLVVASSLSLAPSPQAILGNGLDTSMISATVLDGARNPVPDGTRVVFRTTRGTFPGLTDTMAVLTRNGVAAAPLRSEISASGVISAGVTATTDGVGGTLLVASTEVFFHQGALQGRVRLALEARQVPGAVVVLHDPAGNEAGRDTTDGEGIYVIPISRPGTFTRTILYITRFGDRVETSAPLVLAPPIPGGSTTASLLNAISGTVLDRSTGRPVREPDIPVTLNRVEQSGAALGKAQITARTTDNRGVFVFDSLAPGTYEIRVDHPHYAGSLLIQDTASGSFAVEADISAAEIAALELVKTANKRIAEPGDGIFYTIEIRNSSLTTSVAGIRIIDDLPVGFVYAPLSSRLGQKSLGEPAGTRTLVWALPDTLAAGESMRLTYALTIGPGALDGHGINRARSVGVDVTGDSVRSGESSVQVLVHPGVFTDRGIILGKVFADLNANGMQDPGEWGLAGVELWMEDGTHIVTGSDGKYSLPEVMPGQHVLRVDQRTLPPDATLLARGTDFAGDGVLRFVRLTEGGVARADFYVTGPSLKAKALESLRPGERDCAKPVRKILVPPPAPVPGSRTTALTGDCGPDADAHSGRK